MTTPHMPTYSKSRRAATIAEKMHMTRVASLGCIICKLPAEIHHVKDKISRNRNHLRVLPICPHHHRNGGHGVAYHSGKVQWEKNFSSQADLLAKVNALLEKMG